MDSPACPWPRIGPHPLTLSYWIIARARKTTLTRTPPKTWPRDTLLLKSFFMDKMMKTPRVARWKSEVMVVPQLITGPRSDSFRFVSLCWIVALFFVKQPALSASMDCIAYRHTDFDPTFNLMKQTLTGIKKEIPTWSLQPKFDGWTLYNLEFYTYYAQKAS